MPKHPLRLPRRLAGGVLAASLACTASPGRGADALVSSAGALRLASPECALAPHLFTPSWSPRDARSAGDPAADGSVGFRLDGSSGGAIHGRATFRAAADGSVEAEYVFTPERDEPLNALFVGVSLPVGELAGGRWTADDREGIFPSVGGEPSLFSGRVRSLVLEPASRAWNLRFAFAEPCSAILQDDRRWGPTFSVRFGHNGPSQTFPAGQSFTIRCTVSAATPLALAVDAPVTLTAGREWLPLAAETEILPGSAVDFSTLGLADAPAGKHGRVLAKGPHFEFERQPGVRQRFYGVNLCFTANFPEPAEAERLAERLARIGYNAVRFHHHDGGLVEGSRDGTTLHAGNLGKLDALVAACVARGLYLTTDLYVSRPVPWRTVGIDRDGTIPMDTYKLLVPVHDTTWENLKAFSRAWLTHVNPHTGRSLAVEPALAWISLINEGNYGNHYGELRKLPAWQEAWRVWLAERRAAAPAEFAAIPDELPTDLAAATRHAVAGVQFLNAIEDRFLVRARAFLRDELGCHALLSNQNSWTYFASDQVVRHERYDYADDHFYVDHPQFLERSWSLPSRCDNANPIRNDAMGASGVVYTRLLDKPFTITEYNYSGPGRFRGVGGIVTGTLAALQDWSGLWRFAFSHSADSLRGERGPRMNYFDMAGDPLSLAAERASLCLFLRGDLAPLARRYELLIPADASTRLRDAMPRNRASWPWLAWYARLGTRIAETPTPGATWSARFPEAYATPSADLRALLQPDPAAALPPAGDGAVLLDASQGTFVIRTPRTCGGFAEDGSVNAGALVFEVSDAAATVWVSSLDDQPIARSSRLLLTHLTDVQNSGIRYAERARQTLLDWGTLPHLVRNGRAEVRLALTEPGAYRVHALSPSGRRVAEIPCSVANGQLVFTAAVDAVPGTATLLYEIVRAPIDGIGTNR